MRTAPSSQLARVYTLERGAGLTHTFCTHMRRRLRARGKPQRTRTRGGRVLAPPGRHRAPLPTGSVESSAHFFMTIIAVAMRATAIAPPTKILFCSSFCFFAGHAPGSHAQLPVPHPQDPSVHVQSGPQVHTMVVCLRRTREGSRAGWVARAAVMGAHQTGVSVHGRSGVAPVCLQNGLLAAPHDSFLFAKKNLHSWAQCPPSLARGGC